jgi:hypothetical protein
MLSIHIFTDQYNITSQKPIISNIYILVLMYIQFTTKMKCTTEKKKYQNIKK